MFLSQHVNLGAQNQAEELSYNSEKSSKPSELRLEGREKQIYKLITESIQDEKF